MRDFDRRAGLFLWGFFLVFALFLTAPMALLALTARRADEQLAAGVFAALAFPVVMLIAIGVAALVRSLKRHHGVLHALDELRARLGGQVVLPTLGSPLVQPRIITNVRGRELEVRFVRMTRRQAMTHGGEWHLMVMVATRPAFRLGLVTRQLVVEVAARLFGARVTDWGPHLTLVSDHSDHATAFFNDPAIAPHWQRIFSLNPTPSKLQFAPVSSLNYLGALYMGAWDPNRGAADIGAIVESVTAMAERIDAGAPR